MKLRDLALPLARTNEPSVGVKYPQVAQDISVDHRVVFSPANRQAGWRVAQRLQVQQRRIQAHFGVK